MATAKATLSNFRQAPRKMRLVANMVRGKKVADVLVNLDFTAKKASAPIKNLIVSAVANAKALDIPTDNLIIKKITVDAGKIMYRRLPAWHGMAHPMRKRTSRVTVELEESEGKTVKAEAKVKKEAKSDKKEKTVKKTTKSKK